MKVARAGGQDAAHVNAFFRRAGIATLTTRELFDFAVDPTITPERLDGALDALARLAAARPAGAAAEEDAGVAAQARLFSAIGGESLRYPLLEEGLRHLLRTRWVELTIPMPKHG